MRRIWCLLIIFASVACMVGCTSGWRLYKFDAAGFSISAPGKLIEEKTTKSTSIGTAAAVHYSLENNGTTYSVVVMDYTDEWLKDFDVQKALTSARDEMTATVSGKIASTKNIELNKSSGLEFIADFKSSDNKDMTLWAKILIVKKRQYVIAATVEKASGNESSAAKFLKSFKLN